MRSACSWDSTWGWRQRVLHVQHVQLGLHLQLWLGLHLRLWLGLRVQLGQRS